MVCAVMRGASPGEHDHVIVRLEGFAGGHQSVSGAALRLLQNEADSGLSHSLAYALSFVANDGIHIFCRHDLGGRRDNMGQQWLSTHFVQHLGVFGLKTSTLARCHDGNGNARHLSWFGFLHSNQS